MKKLVVALAGLGVVAGCSADLSGRTSAQSWNLVADESGALVDPAHPEFGKYANGREDLQSLTVFVDGTGTVCASDGNDRWCGGPPAGIPYSIRGVLGGDVLTIRVYDTNGNVRQELATAAVSSSTTNEGSCADATTPTGAPCQICTDASGNVVSNSCIDGAGDYITGAKSQESNQVCDASLGAKLFIDTANEMLKRIGLEITLAVPPDTAYATFKKGELKVGKSDCDDILKFFDKEFSDDHQGTSDYIFGDAAIKELHEQGRLRGGQLVTRAMMQACASIPAGCEMGAVAVGIVGAGGWASNDLCEGGKYTEQGVKECRGSPLVLDLAGNGLALKDAGQGAMFALTAGAPSSVGWIAGGDDALLALDVNGDGVINGGSELFGEATGGWAADGFQALARHDDNLDGVIDAHDAVYKKLLAWVDNGDGVSQKSELKSLSAVGVRSIPVTSRKVGEFDAFGNELGLENAATLFSGRQIPVVDVWFKMGRKTK